MENWEKTEPKDCRNTIQKIEDVEKVLGIKAEDTNILPLETRIRNAAQFIWDSPDKFFRDVPHMSDQVRTLHWILRPNIED